MTPLLTKRRVLAAKVEDTPGEAEALTASEGAFNAFEVTINPNIEFVQREGQSALSPLPGVVAGHGGTISFSIELASDANLADLLLACGMKKPASSYVPDSACATWLTIGVFEDGVYKKLRGAQGTPALVAETGKPARVNFTFTGIWCVPEDAELIAPNYPSYTPPRFAGSSVLLDSYAPKISRLTIDMGNTVILREDPADGGQADGSGYCTAAITGRRITGSMDPEAQLVGTEDSYGDWIDGTTRALAIVLGESGGDQVTIEAPCLQFTNLQEADRNGLQVDTLEFQLVRSADAGDDELSITFA